ncbi:2586_t:CDS:2, partial [Funneliformis geosporum]
TYLPTIHMIGCKNAMSMMDHSKKAKPAISDWVPNAEEDTQVVELQVPSLTAEASTSRSPSPVPSTNNNVDNEIIETESTPMVTENVIETTSDDDDNHESNDGGSRLSILNKIKRKPNATQPAALPVVTDGVFSNLSAKPDTEADKEDENPPPYEAAAADAAPPYWETTIIAPGYSGDEILVEGLPVGNFFSFIWNMLVSMSFQFVGFLLTYLLHTSHAAKKMAGNNKNSVGDQYRNNEGQEQISTQRRYDQPSTRRNNGPIKEGYGGCNFVNNYLNNNQVVPRRGEFNNDQARIEPLSNNKSFNVDQSPRRKDHSNSRNESFKNGHSPRRNVSFNNDQISPRRNESFNNDQTSPRRNESFNYDQSTPHRNESFKNGHSPRRNGSFNNDQTSPRRNESFNNDQTTPRRNESFKNDHVHRRNESFNYDQSTPHRNESFKNDHSHRRNESFNNDQSVPRRNDNFRNDHSVPRRNESFNNGQSVSQRNESFRNDQSSTHRNETFYNNQSSRRHEKFQSPRNENFKNNQSTPRRKEFFNNGPPRRHENFNNEQSAQLRNGSFNNEQSALNHNENFKNEQSVPHRKESFHSDQPVPHRRQGSFSNEQSSLSRNEDLKNEPSASHRKEYFKNGQSRSENINLDQSSSPRHNDNFSGDRSTSHRNEHFNSQHTTHHNNNFNNDQSAPCRNESFNNEQGGSCYSEHSNNDPGVSRYNEHPHNNQGTPQGDRLINQSNCHSVVQSNLDDIRSQSNQRSFKPYNTPPTRQDVMMDCDPHPSSKDSHGMKAPMTEELGGWDSQPIDVMSNRQTNRWEAAAADPSLLMTKIESNPLKKASEDVEVKDTNICSASSTSTEVIKSAEQTDDDEVDWVISSNELISPKLETDRPHSPRFDLLDQEENKKRNTWNNKGKYWGRPRRNEEILKDEGYDGFEGVSFPPPYPICPVSSATDLKPPERPKVAKMVAKIFENDSRSSAQSFEKLAQLSKELWSGCTDVPLDWASATDIEEYLNVKEENKNLGSNWDFNSDDGIRPLPIKRPKEQDWPDTGTFDNIHEDANPDSTYSYNSSSNTASTSKFPKFQTQLAQGYEDHQHVLTAVQMDGDVCLSEYEFSRFKKGGRLEIKRKMVQIPSTEYFASTGGSRSRRQGKIRSYDAEHVCDMVNGIYHTIPTNWLNCILGVAQELIPKIKLFDTETIQKLLKILSSHLVLKTDNKDTEQLIRIVIANDGFFTEVFSYMKEEVNCGSDLMPIIRLSDFILNLFPESARNISHNDITEVCDKIRSTFSEVESREVDARLKNIREMVQYAKKMSSKPQTPPWITTHSKNYVDKPLVPLPEEIFNLKAMIIKPTLTQHLVNRPWLPDYEEIYREVHYDLIRTEVLEDLQRASVSFFAVNCKDYVLPENSPLYNYIFYRDVRIVNTFIDRNFTPYVRVGFKPSRPVNWTKGEHLIYGTFVLLFKVKTDSGNVSVDTLSMVWAMVEYFSLDEVRFNERQESCVGLNFFASEFDKLDLNGKYVMLESTLNYASIRPVMEWLKEPSNGIQRISPLSRELFTCVLDKSTPDYLDNVAFDITSILVDQKQPVIPKSRADWPHYWTPYSSPVYNMEFSCVLALRQIISRKVAVIVAPVVTSKAKVAAKAVELLKQAIKKSHCFEPILILTRSSYALDSILEQLLPSFPDLIRCGSFSSCSNPELKARQIHGVANDHLIFKRGSDPLRKEWLKIRQRISNEQKTLDDLWNFRRAALTLEYFAETCPRAFREQLIPAKLKNCDYKNLGFASEYAMVLRCLEIWLEGESESNTLDNILKSKKNSSAAEAKKKSPSKKDFPAFPSSNHSNIQRTSTSFPTKFGAWTKAVTNQSFDDNNQGTICSLQHNSELSTNNSDYLLLKETINNKGPRSHNDSQISSLLTEISKSYLFENDQMKNDDDISTPSDFDNEILENQINDRVICKCEEDQNLNELKPEGQNYRYQIDFANVSKNFWSKSGKGIWIMTLNERRLLYNRFHQHHIEFCDPEIQERQKKAIFESEKLETTRVARWTEVCNFAPVIGMTFSYATAYREVLASVKPRVCIVDEASEISEAHLMSLISSNRLEHLIMFGDNQLSKPNIKSKTAQEHGLDVSLFERWIECGGDHINLKQQSRMHPSVHELVRTLYNNVDPTEHSVAENIPKIMGVPSHVFFMTHNYYDENWKTNTFEANFVANFAFYLYQQGYDPARITILTPHVAQQKLIWKSLKPELIKEPGQTLPYNIFGRLDKDKAKAGKIQVKLIDEHNNDENQIVLLSLVAVSEKWYEEAFKVLNDKKRVIMALSKALHALYIFGNETMLHKSQIWSPVIEKIKTIPNAFGSSLTLDCNTHINKKIDITTDKDFETKVPYGGCSEPCHGLLKCGHACQRKCHPIHHTKEVEYICFRQCGGQHRPQKCEHDCPKECHECEKAGKCPPCEQLVDSKLPCGHIKSIPCHQMNTDHSNRVCEEDVTLKLPCGHEHKVKCYQKNNEEIIMTMECKGMKLFTFDNCNHSIKLPCSTKSPVCQETCGKMFDCGHLCHRQCGIEHSHERSNCTRECPKSLICGHQCANGCSEPERHTAFCVKSCRIKCLHGHVCPKTCHEECTRCLEPCPWKCPHSVCKKRCYEFCNRHPCNMRCPRVLKCTHQCNGFCGEACPPCLTCNPNMQCTITLQSFSELKDFERLYMLPECQCVFMAEGLDMYFKNQVKNGEHTAVKLWQCPHCQEPIFTAMRYNRYLKTEINLWNVIKRKQETARSLISAEERKQIIDAMNEETRTADFNSMVGGRWFVCPNNHPYYIGNCGGATQISHCPDCGDVIGGTQHRVVPSNRFYGEFDNSTTPAWPGQH